MRALIALEIPDDSSLWPYEDEPGVLVRVEPQDLVQDFVEDARGFSLDVRIDVLEITP